jgi:hypothetical protein
MDKESTEKLIKNTFQNSFDKERYIYFIKNLLKRYDESKVFHLQGCYIPKAFENFVKTYERIGTYVDPEGKKIDLLIVYLKKETTLDRARTAQRNFVAHYLKERGEKDAGLVAFVSPEEPEKEDWRFSFVKMEYKFEKTPIGDVKIKQEFTPARRYSFLVGKNENSHTAQSCFMSILKDDTYNPKLYEIEEAFSIEKVTKEFFEKYRNLFLEIKDSLDEIVKRDEEIKQEFQEKGVNVVDFSKKLLGQIVFLYFLQKKGWFGIEKGQKWGSGSKHFLRELFEKKHCNYENFFNNILEPLFYEALRNDRSYDDHYFSYFKCKIPFLNGGLFDPLNDYDWAKTDILLPNTLFSNYNKTKEGDIGTGILDIFDRYNFTVKEDEPLEKEVAVDPEMLGKVFENLLEVKDRKSKGTYYTPREIVHYMCQQSLINYLITELNGKQESRTKEEKIQMKLLDKPDPVQQNLIIEKDSNIISKEDIEKLIRYGDTTIENDNHVATKGEETKTYSFKLPENIRKNAEIIDEALKNICVCDPAIGSGAFPVGMMNEITRARNVLTSYLSLREAEATKQSRTIYNFKRHAIQNCLYGVDIDPGAVEIAKLRLWLSLIVDEEDITQIKPLPNLDYKIVCGNSLLGVERNLENWKLFTKLEELKPIFFNETNPTNRQTYKKQIDDLISKITNGHKDFDFEVYFSEVFHNKGGFNVVIGNPPYIDSEKMVRVMPKFRDTISKSYITAKGNWDLYIPFWELGVKLLNNGGNSVFITPNKWLAIGYGKNLRELLRSYIYKIGNCDQVKVFEAGNSPVIVFISKSLNNNDVQVDHFDLDYNISKKVISQHSVLNGENWGFLLSTNLDLILKIMRSPQRVSQDYYAENPFTVSEAYEVQKNLIDLKTIGDFDNSKYFKFVNTGTIEKYYFLWSLKLTTYLKKKYQAPIIERYVFKKKFPKRFDQMSMSKIIISGMRHFECALDPDGGMVAGKSTVILKGKNNANIKIILALLNSNLISFFIKEAFGVLGIGGGINFTAQLVENLPLPSIDDEEKKKLGGLADCILKIVESEKWLNKTSEKAKINDYEKQIDQLVYKLYDLTEDEIKIVERE